MPSRVVYFIRHGQADYNRLKCVNAHPEVSNNLTATGRKQAALCAEELAEAGIEALYCSEFPRARQTAEIINRSIAVPLHVDSRLNETGAYAFEGMAASAWHQAQVPDRLSALVPGCEPFAAMKSRLASFLDSLRGSPWQGVGVVSHEEPIQVMLGILDGIPDEQAKSRAIPHCVVFRRSL